MPIHAARSRSHPARREPICLSRTPTSLSGGGDDVRGSRPRARSPRLHSAPNAFHYPGGAPQRLLPNGAAPVLCARLIGDYGEFLLNYPIETMLVTDRGFLEWRRRTSGRVARTTAPWPVRGRIDRRVRSSRMRHVFDYCSHVWVRARPAATWGCERYAMLVAPLQQRPWRSR
jgi:hypothetical protein